jgi:hypothetical protein
MNKTIKEKKEEKKEAIQLLYDIGCKDANIIIRDDFPKFDCLVFNIKYNEKEDFIDLNRYTDNIQKLYKDNDLFRKKVDVDNEGFNLDDEDWDIDREDTIFEFFEKTINEFFIEIVIHQYVIPQIRFTDYNYFSIKYYTDDTLRKNNTYVKNTYVIFFERSKYKSENISSSDIKITKSNKTFTVSHICKIEEFRYRDKMKRFFKSIKNIKSKFFNFTRKNSK